MGTIRPMRNFLCFGTWRLTYGQSETDNAALALHSRWFSGSLEADRSAASKVTKRSWIATPPHRKIVGTYAARPGLTYGTKLHVLYCVSRSHDIKRLVARSPVPGNPRYFSPTPSRLREACSAKALLPCRYRCR